MKLAQLLCSTPANVGANFCTGAKRTDTAFSPLAFELPPPLPSAFFLVLFLQIRKNEVGSVITPEVLRNCTSVQQLRLAGHVARERDGRGHGQALHEPLARPAVRGL